MFENLINDSLFEQGSNKPISELQLAARIDLVKEAVPGLDMFFALENKEDGEIFLVSKTKDPKVQDIGIDKRTPSQQLKIKFLGKVPLARTLTYLGSSTIFVGKSFRRSHNT